MSSLAPRSFRSLARPIGFPFFGSLATGVFFASFAGAPATAQQVLHTFSGTTSDTHFGEMVAGAGDVNNDGYDDLIVGAPWANDAGTYSGNATVFSGLDGSVLYFFPGDSDMDYFGFSADGLGDLNGDGYGDFAIGIPFADTPLAASAGQVKVFSGLDGSILYTLDGVKLHDYFGWSVSRAGDVDLDGVGDLIVGIVRADFGAKNAGRVQVFSGIDGTLLFTFDGPGAWAEFGHSVSAAGDVNADGIPDVIVGARADSSSTGQQAGSASVYSGFDGALLYYYSGSPGDYMGTSVCAAGDIDGDGYDDFAIGVPEDDAPLASNTGSARVHSGRTGELLRSYEGIWGGDRVGHTVRGGGDFDGDGQVDLLVGAWGDDHLWFGSGRVTAYSGVDGEPLLIVDGPEPRYLYGRFLAMAGDVDGDGHDDLIVGVQNYHGSIPYAGGALVYSGVPAEPGSGYCFGDGTGTTCPCFNLGGSGEGCQNSSARGAILAATGYPAQDEIVLHASQCPGGVFGLFYSGSNALAGTPFGDGLKCVSGGIIRLEVVVTDGAGDAHSSVDLPAKEGLSGGELRHYQFWYRDPVGTCGRDFNLSNGYSIQW